jgi:hypothetical protein
VRHSRFGVETPKHFTPATGYAQGNPANRSLDTGVPPVAKQRKPSPAQELRCSAINIEGNHSDELLQALKSLILFMFMERRAER